MLSVLSAFVRTDEGCGSDEIELDFKPRRSFSLRDVAASLPVTVKCMTMGRRSLGVKSQREKVLWKARSMAEIASGRADLEMTDRKQRVA